LDNNEVVASGYRSRAVPCFSFCGCRKYQAQNQNVLDLVLSSTLGNTPATQKTDKNQKSRRHIKTEYSPKSSPPPFYLLEELSIQTYQDVFKIGPSAPRSSCRQ
jgi:hypothetical protein